MAEIFAAGDVLAHAIVEGGYWIRGYAPTWAIAVMKDGRVFDRIAEKYTGELLRQIFDATQLAVVRRAIDGRAVSDPLAQQNSRCSGMFPGAAMRGGFYG